MGKKKSKNLPYIIEKSTLRWKNGPPYVQNINEIKEPEATKMVQKLKHSSDVRHLLCHYFLQDGNNNGYGTFQGRVAQFKRIHRSGGLDIMFKPLHVSFTTPDGITHQGKETHVWIQDNGAFAAMHIQAGDFFEFTAKVYLYDRGQGNYDFSLKDCDNVRKINQKRFSNTSDLMLRPFMIIACDYCPQQDLCTRNICRNQEWRRQTAIGFAHPVRQTSKPQITSKAWNPLIASLADFNPIPEIPELVVVTTEEELLKTLGEIEEMYRQMHVGYVQQSIRI